MHDYVELRDNMDLVVDPARRHLATSQPTGMYVRAFDEGKWVTTDIIALQETSLRYWLRSDGEKNEWAENVVLRLLDYP